MVENSQAQLVCVAEGVPQPSLSWEKDGNPLTEGTGEYTILPSGELVIDIAQVGETKGRHWDNNLLTVQQPNRAPHKLRLLRGVAHSL